MLKSQPRTGSRLFTAGIAVAATAAAVVVSTATAAFAANIPVTVTPGGGPPSGTVTIVDPGGTAWLSGTPVATFTTAACAATYTAPGAAIIAAPTTTASTDNKTATVGVPTTLTLASNAAKTYYVCVYSSNVVGTGALIGNGTYTVTPVVTVAPANGASGGGNTVTVTVPSTGPSVTGSLFVTFATRACPSTYSAAANVPATATVVTGSTTQVTAPVPVGVGGPNGTGFAVCFYTGTGSGTLIATSAQSAYTVNLAPVTLSSLIGPVSTAPAPVNLTISSPTTNPFLTGVTTPMVVLVAAPATCTGLYPSVATLAATGRKLANNKFALTVPTGAVVVGGLPTVYNICAYSSSSTTTGRLLSSSAYTVAVGPTVTSVSPSSGPALGNSMITVSGSDFPTTPGSIQATLGGTPLGSITPIDSTTFTAMTPAHSVGTATLTVSTSTGSDSVSAAYTYVNSIVVQPNTAPNTAAAQDVDVSGTGFLSYAFSTTPVASTTTDSHVYLVSGTYNGVTGTGNTVKQNGPVAECVNVLVISDNELVCTLNLTAAFNPAGAMAASGYHSLTDAVTLASSNILTSALGTFTQADVGKALSQTSNTEIAVGATIVAVLDSHTAVMSDPSVQAGTGLSVTIGYSRSTVTAAASSGASTVVGSAATFSQADVGRTVTGTGIAANTVITAVNDTGTTATLSIPTSGTVTSLTAVTSGNPVPNGAYNLTIVNNGANNASAGTTYVQTVVSSGSTFTVAPF